MRLHARDGGTGVACAVVVATRPGGAVLAQQVKRGRQMQTTVVNVKRLTRKAGYRAEPRTVAVHAEFGRRGW